MIMLFTMTVAVATSIGLYVMVLFVSGKTGIFSVITSVFGYFPDL